MPAIALTAAEIAAAEAAAIAAAEAAAVHAAQVAAAQAAQAAAAQAATQAAATTAANTAAANTATATATNAATNQSVLQAIGASPAAPASAAQLGGYGAGAAGGIPTLGAGAGTGANLGYEALAKEVSGIEQLVNAANYPLPSAVPTVPSVPNIVPSGAEYIPPSNFGAPPASPTGDVTFGMGENQIATVKPFDFGWADKTNYMTPDAAYSAVSSSVPVPSPPPPAPVVISGPPPVTSALPDPALPQFNPQQYLIDTMPGSFVAPPSAPPVAPLYGSAQPPAPPSMGPNIFPDIVPQAPAPAPVVEAPSLGGPGTGYQGQAVQIGSGSNATPYTSAELQTMYGQSPSGIESLFNQGLDYVKNNKLSTALGANALVNYLDKPDPYEKPKYKSTFKPGLYSGYQPVQPTPYRPQYAAGGVADLGGYSDGGRMLKGPGDGVSDSIPATIGGKQPARLADGEFVIPARIVSEIGNGSSEAGARKLYAMMDRIQNARKKSIKNVAANTKADKYLPR